MVRTDLDNELAAAPAHGSAYFITASDQIRLRIGVWQDANAKKGTIFLLPGRADFIEKLGHAVTDLHAEGYAVCVLEFRGLGLSDRLLTDKRAGHVDEFLDYQMDVEAMLSAAKSLGLPKPWNLLGNSMGGCIGLRAVVDGKPFTACAFTSPMWGIQLSPILRIIAPIITGSIRFAGKGHVYALGKNGENETLAWSFDENEITGDADMFDHLQQVNRAVDDHWIGGPTYGWLQQALKETKALSKCASPNLRAITFSAELDQLVEQSAIEQRMARWPDGEYESISGARHDLLRAGGDVRTSVLKKIVDFFDA
ncbi:MAG: alpha/beta hydrolase [Pseudomonadota bacterium]